jgi:hypothetical protein
MLAYDSKKRLGLLKDIYWSSAKTIKKVTAPAKNEADWIRVFNTKILKLPKEDLDQLKDAMGYSDNPKAKAAINKESFKAAFRDTFSALSADRKEKFLKKVKEDISVKRLAKLLLPKRVDLAGDWEAPLRWLRGALKENRGLTTGIYVKLGYEKEDYANDEERKIAFDKLFQNKYLGLSKKEKMALTRFVSPSTGKKKPMTKKNLEEFIRLMFSGKD